MDVETRISELIALGHPDTSARFIARLEAENVTNMAEKDAALAAALAEKKAALAVAEQAVVNAIQVLNGHWSVRNESARLVDVLKPLRHLQVGGHIDVSGRHPRGAGAHALAQDDPCQLFRKAALGCAHTDQLGSDWRIVNADPDARLLRELILRLYLVLGLKDCPAPVHYT